MTQTSSSAAKFGDETGHQLPASHRLTVDETFAALGTDPTIGLHDDEVRRRRDEVGSNKLDDAAKRPRWKALVDQFKDFLIIILLVAAVVSFVVSGELKTPIVIAIVVVMNAIIGFIQESRAEASLDALKKMLVTSARVRRGGELVAIDAVDLVPGDVVHLEAGDRVPADGRLVSATNVEIEEAALTGESQPGPKGTDAIDRAEVPLGDRRNMAYMNTTLTRGRAEMVVTATGMNTEIGRIAGLLRDTTSEKTPLQKQLDHLAHTLAKLAGVIVALVFIIGLIRGQSLESLFITGVALAVASIPEGLPAVTVVTLAVGVGKMAKRNAIVKRLAAVETLGCTSVICSDKTGTLTLNQMTARELVFRGHRHTVTGEGYDPDGSIESVIGDHELALDAVLLAMALANDAALQRNESGEWEVVGDPTEGALVVLAAKGGLNVTKVRADLPRVAEVPFDSTNKFMATFHLMTNDSGDPVVRVYAKGAPDVLLARSARVVSSGGVARPVDAVRGELVSENERIAAQGMRVLAVASRDLTPDEFDTIADPELAVTGLTLLGLVGIVDPPRPEARDAIAEARSAGITVKMITGDHAATAAAIGRELGLNGRAVTGADLDTLDDDALDAQIDDISVFARVSPEHKIRLVAALQRTGRVVAMTGDGVNDAPALKKADMGIAMGITGTEVTKEAATMVLTDDNFATIVGAVRQGRTIYDNIVKFVRFQLATTLGFAATFLASSVVNLSGGKPFTAIQILWVNLIMDGPPAMALGVDPAEPDIMQRTPRSPSERILSPSRMAQIVFAAVIMAAGSLAVLALAPGVEPKAGTATVAGTMAFTTFIAFQFFNILNARSERRSVFNRATLANAKLWAALGTVGVLQIGVVHWGPMQRLFDTTSLTGGQWLVSIAVASTILWLDEARKLIAYVAGRTSPTTESSTTVTDSHPTPIQAS